MKNGLTIVLLVITLASCVSEIPIEQTFIDDQIVITGLVSPNTRPEIQIANIRNLSRNDSARAEKPYTIQLYEDKTLIYTEESVKSIFILPLIVRAGSVYDLNMQFKDAFISATTSIPEAVRIQQADIRYTSISTMNYDKLSEVIIEWSDPPDINNFYEMQIINAKGRPYQFYSFENISDPILLQEAGLDYDPASFVFSDVSFSGDQYQMRLLIQGFPKEVLVILRSLSPEYYHYIKSWHKHSYQQNTGIQIDDALEDYDYIALLLKGDPVPLYSNIENGIGIFAGYSEDIKKFRYIQ